MMVHSYNVTPPCALNFSPRPILLSQKTATSSEHGTAGLARQCAWPTPSTGCSHSISAAAPPHHILQLRVSGPTLLAPTCARRDYPATTVLLCHSHQGSSDQFFSRLYRMCKQVFFKVAQKLTVVTIQAGRLYYKSSAYMRLSITFCWLDGASYLDISHAHGTLVSCTYFYICETLQDIDGCLQIKFPYRDNQWLEESSKGSTRHGPSLLPGCCVAIKICEPSRRDMDKSSTYFNRKGFFCNKPTSCV